MCTKPITIPTRSRIISAVFNEHLFIDVPCGQCDECYEVKQREWQFRFFYEAKRSKFIYYDTLTYDNNHVPHVSDFFKTDVDCQCFNRKHLQDFLKRLRRKLQYHCHVDENAFKYFIASEYGTSEGINLRTGKPYTHRPHYHILFFVNFDIDPFLLSEYVSQCWKNGRTDGLPYKSRFYVKDHNIISGCSLKVTNYVAKYVNKSSVYSAKIEPIIQRLRDSLDKSRYLTYSSYKKDYRNIAHQLRQFHLQSHHFGENFIYDCDVDMLSRNPVVKLTLNSFVMSIPLPLYYVRKLFYTLETFHSFKSFVPNDFGFTYLETRYKQKLDLVAVKLQNMIQKTSIKFPYSLESLVSYVVNERKTNLKPYLYLTPAEKTNFPFYVHYYSDSDIDINKKPLLGYSVDNSFQDPMPFFLRTSFLGKQEPFFVQLKNMYKQIVPMSHKHDFVTEFRNKHLALSSAQ